MAVSTKVNRQKWGGINLMAFSIFLQTLADHKLGRGHTKDELTSIVGVTPGTAGKWLSLLESKNLIYIIHWRKHNNGYTAEWALGFKHFSELKPKAKSVSQSCKEWRRKKQLETESKGLVWDRTNHREKHV